MKTNLLRELKGKTVLITGGAGSIGTALTAKLLDYPVKSVRILDIDEYGLFKMKRQIGDKRLRLLLGSVLDKERLELAGINSDIIIHAAAIKNIEISEFNPIETIDVNINGMVNLIRMVTRNKPKKFLNISTDKAVEPATLYGTTKQLSEHLASWAGTHIEDTKFATIRLGNVFETRGNVFEIWNDEVKNKSPLSITHQSMQRYFFHIDEAIDFILQCLPLADKGEIFVPKLKLYKIKDLASRISNKHKIIGMRQGEKMFETLITEEEKKHAKSDEKMWIINYYNQKV